ncbi:enoyl-CoA hydratase/isomerase family protein [Candidatus Thorarchaeota archaeon]|jgi:enoyl-CoA hydratase|nr:MAG: enoyl-CoA hydratase/isomerase family protein [Candidatus Thorarchaeota archaeon]
MLYEKAGSFLSPAKNTAVIKFNRVDALNAINDQFIQDLVAALDEAEKDPEIRSVVLASAHDKVFCTGADLKMAQGLLGKPDEVKELVAQGQQAIDKIATLSKPVIAAIHGLCLGGGTEIALACDIRIADEEAKIGTPEVSLGLIPAWGGCMRLPRIIGLGKAMELILTGGQITAQEALEINLVSKVTSVEELMSQAMWYGAKLGGNAPIALKYAKKATHMAFEEDYEDNLEFEVEAAVECFKTNDLAEGISAIFEKRRGKFTGE